MSKNHILALMCGVVMMTVIDLAIGERWDELADVPTPGGGNPGEG